MRWWLRKRNLSPPAKSVEVLEGIPAAGSGDDLRTIYGCVKLRYEPCFDTSMQAGAVRQALSMFKAQAVTPITDSGNLEFGSSRKVLSDVHRPLSSRIIRLCITTISHIISIYITQI